ncbi:GIY-YIG nuclease family protein [Verrucomicrobiota bacterium sgz303538]
MQTSLTAIYAIICLIDQFRYIGGTTRIDKRPDEHWRALANGVHFNKDLQRAYNQHGANSFVFVILEWLADPIELASREKEFLVKAMSAGRAYNRSTRTKVSRGHKLSPETRRKQGAARKGKKRPGFGARIAPLVSKEYRFISPTGEVVETKGLRPLCEKHGLNIGCMSSVASGRLRHHKGWMRG